MHWRLLRQWTSMFSGRTVHPHHAFLRIPTCTQPQVVDSLDMEACTGDNATSQGMVAGPHRHDVEHHFFVLLIVIVLLARVPNVAPRGAALGATVELRPLALQLNCGC